MSRLGKSYSSGVIIRLLQALSDNGPMLKTNLAGKIGVNYQMCVRYLSFLARLNWVQFSSEEGAELISITTHGIDNLKMLRDEHKLKPTGEHRTNPYFSDLLDKSRHATSSRKIKNVVIVDDDENSLVMYESFFEQTKFKAKTFSKPELALRYLIDNPSSYDLVLIDIRMPGLGGLRLFQSIRAANPDVKAMFISSLDAGPELLELFPEIKKGQFLRKPIDKELLIRAVSTILS